MCLPCHFQQSQSSVPASLKHSDGVASIKACMQHVMFQIDAYVKPAIIHSAPKLKTYERDQGWKEG